MKSAQAIFVSPPLVRPEEVLRKLRAASKNRSVILLGQLPRREWPGGRAPRSLSPRQREILRELAMGRGVKEIAERLGLSPKTVESHRSNLMARLGTRRLPQLVRLALQTGILPVSWLFEREPP